MTKRYAVHNLRCAGCAARIEDAIAGLPGVKSAAINLDSARLRVEGEQPELAAMIRLADAIEPGTLFSEMDENEPLPESSEPQPSLFRSEYKLWIAAALFAVGMIFEERLDALLTPFVAKAVFFGIPYLLCGLSVLKKGLQSLLKFDFFNEYTLMGGATIAAAAIGQLPEAVGVMLFYSIGEALQDRAAGNSRRSIRALLAARPTVAHLIEEKDGKQMVNDADPAEIRPGMRILVKPGEKIPLDGTVLTGSSQVDTSPLTGESVPVSVGAGKQVYAGTVNLEGAITVEVTSRFADSSVARILELVEQASANKAPIERFITRFARYYTPAVVFIAALVAVIPPLAGHGTFDEWLYRALVLLVISCPCALVISIPLGYFGGIGAASKKGILVKGGHVLDALHNIKTVAFDKTGTLTYGTPHVVGLESLSPCFSREELYGLAAGAEARSAHPLGKALVSSYRQETGRAPSEAEEFTMRPGQGVTARVEGHWVAAGNEALLESQGTGISTQAAAAAQEYMSRGCTVIYLAVDGSFAGFAALADTVRPQAADMVAALKKGGVEPVLITGDRRGAAERIAGAVGIGTVRSECLPEDKLTVIDQLQNSGRPVCMVGDGINDAPALKRALVGIAMGGIGSDIAVDAADIALVKDEIGELPHLLALSRKMMRTIRANLTFSMVLNFAAIFLAMGGRLEPVVGALVHNAGSVFVILHSALLLRWRQR